MTETYDIVAVDTDSEQDCGFTIDFDRQYNVIQEPFPITERSAILAVDEAYNWFPTTDQIMQLDEGQTVGKATFENRELVNTRCTY